MCRYVIAPAGLNRGTFNITHMDLGYLAGKQGLALCLRKIVVRKVGYVDCYIHDINRKILEEPAVSINASTDRKRREKKNTMYAV